MKARLQEVVVELVWVMTQAAHYPHAGHNNPPLGLGMAAGSTSDGLLTSSDLKLGPLASTRPRCQVVSSIYEEKPLLADLCTQCPHPAEPVVGKPCGPTNAVQVAVTQDTP